MTVSNVIKLTEDEKIWDSYLDIINSFKFWPKEGLLEIGAIEEGTWKWSAPMIKINMLSKKYLYKVLEKFSTREIVEAMKETGKFSNEDIPELETLVSDN